MRLKRIHGDPQRNYAKEWKSWRKERGWTAEEMASAIGVCRRTVQNIEAGRNRPKTKSRAKMEELQKRYREAQ